MTTTVRILGSRAREQVPGTSITLLAPGFRGALAQLTPGVATRADFDLPFAKAAACSDVMLAAQLKLQLEARPPSRSDGLRSRSAMVTHPRVIVPRRHGITYALLQTDETGVSNLLSPQPGDASEAVFRLNVAGRGATNRTLRVLMWPDLQPSGPGSLAASRWERLRRPHQLAQRAIDGTWRQPDWHALAGGRVLLLLHDTFSTAQATFADWLDDPSFELLARAYQGRCLAFTHPTLATGIDENLNWVVTHLGHLPGPIDIVLLPVGAIAAFGVSRYANLATGAFWIIRQGDIRVERLWGDGTLRADHIEGRDVKTITVERRGRSEDEHCIVVIRLLSGRRFRSPRIGSRAEARAVGAEIVRRLGIASENNQI
jgi:hypothetical protein